MSETRCWEERRRGRGEPGTLGDDGDLMRGDRVDPSELETLTGDSGRGDVHRDCTGDRERGPEMKLPETNGGEGGASAVMTGGEPIPAVLGTLGADTQEVRVFCSWLGAPRASAVGVNVWSGISFPLVPLLVFFLFVVLLPVEATAYGGDTPTVANAGCAVELVSGRWGGPVVFVKSQVTL